MFTSHLAQATRGNNWPSIFTRRTQKQLLINLKVLVSSAVSNSRKEDVLSAPFEIRNSLGLTFEAMQVPLVQNRGQPRHQPTPWLFEMHFLTGVFTCESDRNRKRCFVCRRCCPFKMRTLDACSDQVRGPGPLVQSSETSALHINSVSVSLISTFLHIKYLLTAFLCVF